MFNCYMDLCMHNKDYECTFAGVEIDSSGKCHQCAPIKDEHEIMEYDKIKTEDTSIFIN